MTSTAASSARGPFPGPIPYDENDRRFFAGRETELRDLEARVRNGHLVLLSAYSGLGKTSFIRAGLVPGLRKKRAAALAKGKTAFSPAVLVVRDWLYGSVTTPDEVYCTAIRHSIEQLAQVGSYYVEERESIERDLESLAAVPVPKPANAFGYIAELAAATGHLVLILDQFEETLQRSIEHTNAMCLILARLHKSVTDVSILVSFRQEFFSRFYDLEKIVGPLGPRTLMLKPIPAPTLYQALRTAAETAGAIVEPYEAGMSSDVITDLIAASEYVAPQSNETQQRMGQSLRLLKLQAALRELYRVARARGDAETVRITRETLDSLLDNPHAQEVKVEFVESALARYIDTEVLPALHATERGQIHNQILEQRRAAAKMANLFSTGTLKTSLPGSRLVALAFEEEWDVLNTTWPEIEEALEGAADFVDEASTKARLEGLGLATDVPAEDFVLSGPLRHARSIFDTAVQLVKLAGDTFDALARGNLIREKLGPEGVYYELVHDGFAEAFDDWAEAASKEPRHTLAATVAQVGETLAWSSLFGTIEEVCWLGCWVGPAIAGEMLEISGVHLKHCDLQRTVFERCKFIGCHFDRCDLSGVEFDSCEFVDDAGKGTTFSHCNGSGIQFNGGRASSLRFVRCDLQHLWWGRDSEISLDGVAFEHSTIRQADVRSVRVISPLRFTGCSVQLSHLEPIVHPETLRVDISETEFYFCDLGPQLEAQVLAGSGNRIVASQAETTSPDTPTAADP